jgi:diguanylate cyclase (GGDEF)-like protein
MDSAAAHVSSELDASSLSAAALASAAAVAGDAGPLQGLDDAVAALHGAQPGLLPAVFVLEHGRLWLVAQRGYAVVPDGIRVESGVTGRAVRLGRPQLVRDVRADPDYMAALPGVSSELALPLRAGNAIAGVLNVESEHLLPENAADLLGPLAAVLAPLARALGARRALDLPALARLFAHIGSIRDPDEIAALGAASLPKVLPIESAQVLLWGEAGAPVELAAWRAGATGAAPLTAEALVRTRGLVERTVVCQLIASEHTDGRPVVWLPLRANGEEIGALVGIGVSAAPVDPAQLDTAAVLAAHVAASLDAAVVLRRERESAVTDPLTGVLNRRGLEERLERDLASAQERRSPMSVIVIDCDDLKEINDRAGHEFGDALLQEVAGVLTRSLPAGAGAARLGGDEFVVTLPEAGADLAEALGERIREILAEGLTEAGFPLRISAGISTFPFDGAGATALLRAADQALYAAKEGGKDRIASFHELVRGGNARPERSGRIALERRNRPPSDASVLRDAVSAVEALELETTQEGVCNRLCKSLVFVVGATACSASWIDEDYVVDVTSHALRDVSLGREAAYRISDFPLTDEVIRSGQPRTVSFIDRDVDSAEAFILRELGMNALLMLPLRVGGAPWGLVELYEMRLRRFTDDDVAIAQFLVSQAERRLAAVGPTARSRPRPPVYELPPGGGERRGPRTR